MTVTCAGCGHGFDSFAAFDTHRDPGAMLLPACRHPRDRGLVQVPPDRRWRLPLGASRRLSVSTLAARQADGEAARWSLGHE
jgi:hypothetical protein